MQRMIFLQSVIHFKCRHLPHSDTFTLLSTFDHSNIFSNKRLTCCLHSAMSILNNLINIAKFQYLFNFIFLKYFKKIVIRVIHIIRDKRTCQSMTVCEIVCSTNLRKSVVKHMCFVQSTTLLFAQQSKKYSHCSTDFVCVKSLLKPFVSVWKNVTHWNVIRDRFSNFDVYNLQYL